MNHNPAANILSASFYAGRHKLRLNCEGKLTRQLDRGLGLTEIQVLLTLFRLLTAVSSKANREVLKIMSLRTKTTKCRFSGVCISQLNWEKAQPMRLSVS